VCTTLFSKLESYQAWHNSLTLNAALHAALSEMQQEALCSSLWMEDHKMEHINGHRVLDGLHMEYRTKWPVNMLLSKAVLAEYNKVFGFLLHIKHAKWAVDSILLRVASISDSKINVHRLQLLRSRIMHAVHAIHDYFFTCIIHSLGREFTRDVYQAGDFEQMLQVQRAYLTQLKDRCLLQDKTGMARAAILKLLGFALTFRRGWFKLMRVGTGYLPGHTMIEEDFAEIYRGFTKCHTFLLNILVTLSSRGSHPELETLVSSLEVWRLEPPPLWTPSVTT
jgi:gamma-tubulin complex component 5